MTPRRILVAGIGNVFFGDDGFGVEVARRLSHRRQPEGVVVADFGIRGRDLAYALADGYDAAILIDALPRGGAPGTVYVVEPEVVPAAPLRESHGIDPVAILGMARMLRDELPTLRIVGCEPARTTEMALSAPVAAAIDEAIRVVESLLSDFRSEAATRA